MLVALRPNKGADKDLFIRKKNKQTKNTRGYIVNILKDRKAFSNKKKINK